MEDFDIGPFEDRDKRESEPMGGNIPLTPVGGSTWEPEREQETSFGKESQRTKLLKEHVKGLYQKLSERMDETSEVFHFKYFKLRDGELYYKGKSKSLTTRGGELRSVGAIAEILGKEGLCDLGFDIPTGKVTAQQAVKLNRVEEELPSASDVAKADDIELDPRDCEKHRGLNRTIRRAGNITHA